MTEPAPPPKDSAAPRWTELRARFAALGGPARVVVVLAALVPVVGAVAPLALAPGVILAAVVGTAYLRVAEGRWPPLPRTPVWLVFGFVALGAASALWALDPTTALRNAGKVGVMMMSGLALMAMVTPLTAAERRSVAKVLAVAVAVALATLALTAFGIVLRDLWLGMIHHSFQLYRINREVAALVLLALPAAGAVAVHWGRPRATLFLVVVTVLAAWLASTTAFFAIAVGLVVWLAAGLSFRWTFGAVAAVLVVGVLAAPLVPHALIKEFPRLDQTTVTGNALIHRLFIWKFAADRIAERPLQGWGLRNSRLIPEHVAERPDMSEVTSALAPFWQREILPLHPHNGVIQVWLELGALGATFLFAAFAAALAGVWRRRDGPVAAALPALVMVGAALAASGYGLWQSWWLGGLWLAAVLARAIASPSEPG